MRRETLMDNGFTFQGGIRVVLQGHEAHVRKTPAPANWARRFGWRVVCECGWAGNIWGDQKKPRAEGIQHRTIAAREQAQKEGLWI